MKLFESYEYKILKNGTFNIRATNQTQIQTHGRVVFV